jgi:hypothetical protein
MGIGVSDHRNIQRSHTPQALGIVKAMLIALINHIVAVFIAVHRGGGGNAPKRQERDALDLNELVLIGGTLGG